MRADEVFNEGPTTSQHVESTSDRHFNATTFKLKRTRSMGLFDSSFLVQKPQTDKTKRFVTSQTIDKLNLPQDAGVSLDTEDDSTPSFYTSVITPSNRRKAKEVTTGGISTDTAAAAGAPAGTNQGICLIPKHQLKKQQHYQLDNKLLSSSASSPSSVSPHNDILNQLHDDMDVKDAKNVPREHVDYLTHKWDEDEISKSWKYVVLRRTAVADAARLENASWRTWAQTRNNLKTIPASDLNWDERDNDVTWLYGPVLRPQSTSPYLYDSPSAPLMQHSDSSSIEKLHLINSDQLCSSSASSNEKSHNDIFNNNHNTTNEINANNDNTYSENNSLLNTNDNNDQILNDDSLKLHADDIPTHLKSILKKKSNVERVISDASYSRLQNLLETRENKLKSMSPILEPSTENDFDSNKQSLTLGSTKPNSGPFLIKSSLKNSQLHIRQNQNNKLLSQRENKRIHFNPRVTQCIAIDYPDDFYNDEYKNSSDEEDLTPVSSFLKSNYTDDSDFNINKNTNNNIVIIDKDNDEEMNGESNFNLNDDDDDDDGIMILNKKCFLPNISHKPHLDNKHSKCNHADVTTISPLPATTLNMGPDEVNEEKEQTTLSHNIKTNKGLNHYDYNSVYTGNSDLFKVKDVEMVDIPANIELDDIDNMDIDSSPAASTTTFEHLEDQPMSDVSDSYNSYQSMSDEDSVVDSEINNDDMLTFGSDLKRTLSLGGTTFGSRSNSTQSLSQIKSGLSGLDLKGSGILKSTGSGSKPQLSDLVNSSQKLYQPQPVPPMFQKSHSAFGKGGNTFLFNEGSSSGSESDSGSESESEGFHGGFDLQNAANSCIKGSSLSAVNKQFLGGATSVHDLSRMNANQSKMNKGFLLNSDEFSDDSEEDEISFGARNRKI